MKIICLFVSLFAVTVAAAVIAVEQTRSQSEPDVVVAQRFCPRGC